MDCHPGRSLQIYNTHCKNIIVLVCFVMFMLPSILVNISLSPLTHSPPKLCLIFSKYLSLASTRHQSRTKLMTHFVFWRKFRVEIPPPPIAMLKADENVIDELASMSSSSKNIAMGGGGH